jgi:hypothetical protein
MPRLHADRPVTEDSRSGCRETQCRSGGIASLMLVWGNRMAVGFLCGTSLLNTAAGERWGGPQRNLVGVAIETGGKKLRGREPSLARPSTAENDLLRGLHQMDSRHMSL